LTGYSLAELVGKPVSVIKSGKQSDVFYQHLWESIVNGNIFRGTLINRKKNGELFYEDKTISPLKDQKGEITYFVSVGRDITHQKDYEFQQQQLITGLTAYSHTVAHDLKTPLAILIGFIEMLLADYDSFSREEILSALTRMSDAGQRMNQLIESLLLLAAASSREVEVSPLDTHDLLNSVLRQLAPMIEEKGAQIIKPDTWPQVLGYGPWVEQVWLNYLTNGLKYGGVPPILTLGAEADPKVQQVLFWVQDNGLGIAPEDISRLFKPFSRLHTGHVAGSGLGLSIVQRIVDKLKGTVSVSSNLTSGTRFCFSLPMASEPDNETSS
jgi:two-component system, sensor histidine kinase and response regulator